MPIEKIDENLCIGCGACIETCPMDVFRMNKELQQSTIKYPEDCQICNLCKIYCPVDAITITPTKHAKHLVGWG